MSPNEFSGGFNKILVLSSSESSDSESLLEEDVTSGRNCINKQWEAIERTLYQEPGQQVTDPELLKECKLWRETFPHFRVKGTKIDVNDKEVETEKSVQTIKNHLDCKKLEEKREDIKKRVVGELVGRLIAKYGFEKEEVGKSSVQITEIDDDDDDYEDDNDDNICDTSPKNNIAKGVKKNSAASSVVSTDKESYFERGKRKEIPEVENLSVEQMEKNLYDIFNSWEEESKTAESPKSYDSKNFGDHTRKGLKKSKPPTPLWYKPKMFIPPSESLSNLEKPYEVTNKISKKYEGLIEKIMERKLNGFNPTRHCLSSASKLEAKSYQESLEKLRKESGFSDYIKKKDMPKLNNFNNNWLKRSEINCRTEDKVLSKKTQIVKPTTKKSSNLSTEDDIGDKFLENLRAELSLHYKKPVKKNGILEQIGIQRPKPFMPSTGKSFKSSSCGDLPKKNKKEVKPRQLQSGLEVGKSESNYKNRLKSNKLNNNKGTKSNGNQNPLLPPIETGIICKEIKKIRSKNISKRY